ncbi:hypothetical protein [Archangium lansingense]|uniref:Uncharacterized protein n=1 Tax=Archangium lansingense TaxID=2995310 RepID=A0ABT4A236_9BACT|nr:hypothetical protein [Archangium lansinium]MCY1075656.1 hypothetical protein [Archangium lansinium]
MRNSKRKGLGWKRWTEHYHASLGQPFHRRVSEQAPGSRQDCYEGSLTLACGCSSTYKWIRP